MAVVSLVVAENQLFVGSVVVVVRNLVAVVVAVGAKREVFAGVVSVPPFP